MTVEMIGVFALLLITIVLFISDRFRMDLVALGVVVTLAASGVISPAEAVSGFGNSTVVMIAALFIVGEGLFQTGIAAQTGNLLLRVGGHTEVRLLLCLMPMVALLSAFMSSTGAVALLIPVVMNMARQSGMQPSRLMMPLAFSALIGGMLTLIGTPPNLVVSGQMKDAGLEPFGFFDFTPLGLVILLVGMAYLILAGRFLLPKQNPSDKLFKQQNLADKYALRQQLHKLYLGKDSQLVGKTPMDAVLRSEYEVTIIAIKRRGYFLSALVPVLSRTKMLAWDELVVYGDAENIKRLCEEMVLQEAGFPQKELNEVQQQFGIAEVILPPDSDQVDRSIREGNFREQFGLSVIGVRRRHQPMETYYTETRLEAGDTLLLAGSWQHIRDLETHRDWVVLQTPVPLNEVPTHINRAPYALLIVAAMLVTMTLGWLPTLTAILLAAFFMIISGCVNLTEAYRSMNTTSLILIAGMLPLALAMERSGGLGYLVEQLVYLMEGEALWMLCAGLFLLTSILSQFISNTATTVLVAPIALSSAQQLGLPAEPFMMTVAIAASTAFATPIASPVNTLVLAPGGYRFSDFARVGIPLQLLVLLITLLMVPRLWPWG